MLRSRFGAALGFALVVGAFIAAPVSASTTIGPACSGTCGAYVTYDSNGGPYGATCKYETGSYDLDWIKVYPPKMYGHYAAMTKVQWMYKILRSTNFGGSYSNPYSSSWQTDTASSSTAANSFSSRTWTAPDPNPTGWFKVRILLRWKNSAGNTVGNAKIEYDHYQGKWNGSTDDRSGSDYCLQDW